MSWYQEKAIKELQTAMQDTGSGSPVPFTRRAKLQYKEIPISIAITDMYSDQDAEKLKTALLSLDFVTNVVTLLQQKKLLVTAPPSPSNLSNISYTISQLGYHYIKRG